MKKLLVCVLTLPILVSCGGAFVVKLKPAVESEVLEAAGKQPSDKEAVEAVMGYIRTSFKDPGTVKQLRIFRSFSGVAPTVNPGSFFAPTVNKKGWVVCFESNAKNSYGGYTGLETNYIVMSQGSVFSVNPDWEKGVVNTEECPNEIIYTQK